MAGKFEPKTPVILKAPKDDPITLQALNNANGKNSELCYVAIKGRVFDVTGNKAYLPGGRVFDVTGNKAYLPGGPYHIFAGHDASRALALSSTKASDVMPEWDDLDEKEKQTLDEWMTFFSKRYNVVGLLQADDGCVTVDTPS
ncbi:hypothetical protein K3495_g1182 [Podosphaera aphanis]|nr:hypothetical protein K3495_g1182 [Podosphaera aphanis]